MRGFVIFYRKTKEQRTNSMQRDTQLSQERFASLQQEKATLTTELEIVSAKMSSAQTALQQAEQNVSKFQLENSHLQEEIEALRNVRESLQKQCESVRIVLQQANEDLDKLRSTPSSTTENTITSEYTKVEIDNIRQQYEEEISKLQSQLSEAADNHQADSVTSLVSEVKKIMNSVFRQLQSKFDAEENYDGRAVCKAIKETVLNVTLKLMEKYEQPAAVGARDELIDSSVNSAVIKEESNTSNGRVNESLESNDSNLPTTVAVKDENDSESIASQSIVTTNYDVEKSHNSQSWTPDPPPAPQLTEDDDDADDWLK